MRKQTRAQALEAFEERYGFLVATSLRSVAEQQGKEAETAGPADFARVFTESQERYEKALAEWQDIQEMEEDPA